MQMTALKIIQEAAKQLGLTAPTEVASSTETTGQQLLALLNSAGLDLVMAHTWEVLNVTYQFNSVNGQSSYNFPDGYAYYVDQTFWDASNQLPMTGPLSAQEWQQMSVGLTAPAIRKAFRPYQGAMQIYPTPTGVNAFTYQYISEKWVDSGASPGTYINAIVADTDVPRLDSNLLIKALKYRMWEAKGLDTTSLKEEFVTLFNILTGKSKGATVLGLTRRAQSSLLGTANVPESF